MSARRAVLGVRRRLALFTACVVAPVILLASGWFAASVRDARAREAIETMRLRAVLEATERAIADGLRELRRREDERPFYLYSHYYVPPDLLTLGDVVATSPLASAPTDPRIVGWMQIDPDGTVRTPLRPEPIDDTTGAEARLERVAHSVELAPLRASIHGERAGTLTTRTMTRVVSGEETPPARRPRRSVETAVASNAAAVEEAPLPVRMNFAANQIAAVIQQAQSVDPTAYPGISQSMRVIPQQQSSSIVRTDAPAPQVPVRAPRRQPARIPTIPPRLVPTVPAEIHVTYSPMTWLATPDAFVLARTVTHEGVSVAQGVVLDRAALATWMQEVARRAAVGGPAPRVIEHAGPGCGITKTSRELPPGVALCMPGAILADVRAAHARSLREDVALLAMLLVVVLGALVAVARLARREAELAAERSEFVSAVSHELRTPITTLRMHAEMLAEGLVVPERTSRVHEELVREADRLARLVENVLEASRLEAGRREIRRTRVDLVALVGRVADDLASAATARGMTIVRNGDDELTAEVDAEALERIVVNLVDNALKYASEAEPKTIVITLAARTDAAVITVRDHGPGIPEADRTRVFERFYRVTRAEDTHRPGTGLGLALVRELVEAHGGGVVATAPEGSGLAVVVTLPRAFT